MTSSPSSAGAPLSGSIVSDKVWKVLEEGTDQFGPIGHGWTYSAHPICAAAGVANLKLIDEMNLVQNAGTVGAVFRPSTNDTVECNASNIGSHNLPDGAAFSPAASLSATGGSATGSTEQGFLPILLSRDGDSFFFGIYR